MRDAADLVRTHGIHLADQQDDLIERLEAPYSTRIQRAVREVLTEEGLSDRDKVSRLAGLADHLGLVKQPMPEPLPPISLDDVHLLCWTAITALADEQPSA
jgi:hypothetical protein